MTQIIKQGDAYDLPVEILLNEKPLRTEDVETVEFYIGEYRKLWPGDVTYQDGVFRIRLGQEESFAWAANSNISIDIRVKFTNGDVVGIQRPLRLSVTDAVSEEVL